jgi:methylenetetrahydrofolate dehydrogenase (NADP+)/methenyltetrahydrofolate cyclohydrolase
MYKVKRFSSEKIKDEIKEEILQLGIEPCLAIIRVGDDQASKVYVNNKIKNCEYTGIKSIDIILQEETTQEK